VKLPDFLVIGAMKCGTTTLCQDLMRHPGIFIPACKEVGDLRYDRVLTEAGRASYADYFRFADPSQLCADAATAYSRVQQFQGVPGRAQKVCGPDMRIIYVVRDPCERIKSHHVHLHSKRGFPPDINEAVRQVPDLLDFSRYALQLKAWLEYFPAASVAVVCFEGYRRNRQATMDSIYRFLGLEPVPLQDPNAIYNDAEQRREVGGIFYRAIVSKFYKAYVQQLVPGRVRRPLRNLLSRPAPVPTNASLTAETRSWIEEQLRDDQDQFAALLGFPAPAWVDGAAAEYWGDRIVRSPL
jgi:hypothetical protein